MLRQKELDYPLFDVMPDEPKDWCVSCFFWFGITCGTGYRPTWKLYAFGRPCARNSSDWSEPLRCFSSTSLFLARCLAASRFFCLEPERLGLSSLALILR